MRNPEPIPMTLTAAAKALNKSADESLLHRICHCSQAALDGRGGDQHGGPLETRVSPSISLQRLDLIMVGFNQA